MRKTVSILHYELKMQAKRPAVWGVFLAATAMAQLDCFPSAQNLARLEFLNQPAYFVHRVMTLDALLLLFGLAVLLANRFPADRKNAMGHLFRSYPLERRQYILGKLLGGFCLAYLLTALFRRLCAGRALCHCPMGVAGSFRQGPGAVCLSRQLVHRLGGGGTARRGGHPPVLRSGSPVLWVERRHGGLGGEHALLPAHRWGFVPPAVGTP